jgi:DUF1009 family protein
VSDRHDGTPLAIVCGAGRFPLVVADDVVSRGRPVFLIGMAGVTDPAISAHPHALIRMGQFGRILDLARGAGARDMLFVGAMTRPATWRDVRPDVRLLMLLPRLIRAFRGGDDHLLTALAGAISDAGFTVRGVQEVAPRLMLAEGAAGSASPSAAEIADAEFGFRVLAALSPFDVGQGLVVHNRRVLAVEAAEGTDLMLARVADLRAAGRLHLKGRCGVFVKAPKRGQDRRMDTPAVGPETIARLGAAGLAGIAVAAGEVMAVDAERLTAAADDAGIFVAGFQQEGGA